MKAAVGVLALCFFWSCGSSSGVLAAAPAADNMRDLFAQFRACLALPAGAPAAEITLRFSLRRDGALVGKPHIAYARLPKGAEQKNATLEAVAQALDHCLPARITDGLGGAIAGRPLTFHLTINRGPERGV